MRPIELTRQIKHAAIPVGATRVIESDELPGIHVRLAGIGYQLEVLEEYRIIELGRAIVIPEGFPFDGASVPRLFWTVLASPAELGVVAPAVHDWLYRTGGQRGLFTRGEADRIFLRHMKAEGVPWLRRHAAYVAVRVAGGESWG